MSMKLEFASICVECSRPLRPGTVVDAVKDQKGKWLHMHAGECPDESAAPPPVAPKRTTEDIWTFLYCTRFECSWNNGVAWKRSQGPPPERCYCGSQLISEAQHLEAAA